MKKTLISILSLSLILFWSCDEQLEITPVDQLDASNVFETVDDMEVVLNAVYDVFDPEDLHRYSSIFSDDTKIGADNGGQRVTLHNWVIDPGNGEVGLMWSNHYATISLANRLLEGAESITPGAGENARYDQIRGEAIAMRAYAHLVLMAVYSPDYDAASLGVVYNRDVIVFEQPARSTVGENIADIKADLNEAAGLIPAGVGNDRFNQDAINAIRARLALYEGDFATALNLSTQLLGSYPLATRVQYPEIFEDVSETEVIMKLVKTQNDFFAGGTWYFTGTGGSFIEMSNGLFDVLDPDDIRREVIYDASTSDPAANLHQIGKYLGKDGFAYLNDFKLFRSGEMQLIRAEAQARTGDLAGAAVTVEELRDARFATDQPRPSYANLDAALTDIVAERRLELAFEGHRFIDLKRTRSITSDGLTRDARDCGGGTPCTLEVNDQRWTIPIPVAEIDANPNMVQNPGY